MSTSDLLSIAARCILLPLLAACAANQAGMAGPAEGTSQSDQPTPAEIAAMRSPEPECVRPESAPESDSDAGSTARPFAATEGMAKPTLICLPDIRPTREAIAHGASGFAVVRCIIETDGWLSHCRVMKSLPYIDDQILAGLQSARYTPVMYQGHPQRVEMTFPLRINMFQSRKGEK